MRARSVLGFALLLAWLAFWVHPDADSWAVHLLAVAGILLLISDFARRGVPRVDDTR